MNAILNFYRSSIGKKLIVGMTGILLCSYLVVHLIGNFLLFRNDHGAAFNAYAELLQQVVIIRIIEVGLFAIFFFHIFTAVYTWFMNRTARPVQYKMNKVEANSTLTSRTMFLSGSIVFIFLVVHVRTFWFTSRYQAGEDFRMFDLVKSSFADPVYSIFYCIALFLLGFHLRHGFQSAFQTFGLRNRKYTSLIEFVGILFWLLLPVGFATIPVYFYFFH
jgi:succinate dehydrogenase / fumarate reductase, cytochrome b subunit